MLGPLREIVKQVAKRSMVSSSQRIPKPLLAKPLLWVFGLLFAVMMVYVTYQSTVLAPLEANLVATYVGRDSCVECHRDQAKAFNGSHHDLAMDIANDSTVLADFNDVRLTHFDQPTRFFRRDQKFMVETEGPDGKLAEFEIRYVFGWEPLQQYMVEFPEPAADVSGDSKLKSGGLENENSERRTSIGKLQVLRWSWDTENKRWFHLDPHDVSDRLLPGDPLHWTGIAQRWNTTCAECHSTDLHRGFDVQSGSFQTTFSEIDVSCEACHGPGSVHVAIAQRSRYKPDPNYGHGLASLKASAEHQIQSCAPCHARRSRITDNYRPGENYFDHFNESLLDPMIYFADGQVQDEDYIHGSFLQSKMYHKGIRCSDCHDPHSAKLKEQGNRVCTSCHQHPEAKYDSVGHHFHAVGKPGSFCVDCHMPNTTYMDVDPRRDHSLRIPRPDVSLQLGTPNACTGCHVDPKKLSNPTRLKLEQYLDWIVAAENGDQEIRDELQRVDRWCDEACEKWYGEKRFREPHFAEAIVAARSGQRSSAELIDSWLKKRGSVAPAIVRATLLDTYSLSEPELASAMAKSSLEDEHPLVRKAALSAISRTPNPIARVQMARPLLKDPVRSVRLEAARILVESGRNAMALVSDAERDRALRELEENYRANSDAPGGLLAWGSLEEQLERFESAATKYEAAIRNDPTAVGPRSNLAALLDRLAQQQSTAERVGENPSTISSTTTPPSESEKAGSSSNSNKNGENSLAGRAKELRRQELPLLLRDSQLLPNSSDLQYRAGLALYLDGQLEPATEKLRRAVELSPNRIEYRIALTLLLQKRGMMNDAKREGESMLKIAPNDPQVQSVVEGLLR